MRGWLCRCCCCSKEPMFRHCSLLALRFSWIRSSMYQLLFEYLLPFLLYVDCILYLQSDIENFKKIIRLFFWFLCDKTTFFTDSERPLKRYFEKGVCFRWEECMLQTRRVHPLLVKSKTINNQLFSFFSILVTFIWYKYGISDIFVE